MPKESDVKLWDIVLHHRVSGANPVTALVVGKSDSGRLMAMYYDADDKLTGDTFILVPTIMTRVLSWREISHTMLLERNAEYNYRNHDLPEYC